MAKSKKEIGNIIALEIKKYQDKIEQFQDYLSTHDIQRIGESVEEDKYKEIDTQIKMMNALPSWLVSLKSLKEDAEEDEVELRGGGQMNAAARRLIEKEN